MMTRVHALIVLVVLAALAGCTSPPATMPTGKQPTIQLTASLSSPTDVMLAWNDGGTPPAGRVVEYAMAPDGPFTILGFLTARQRTFAHRDLMPATDFYYRVRPFYGPASNTVDVALPPGAYNDRSRSDDQTWARPQAVARGQVAKLSIRNSITATSAAPTNLTATIVNANGIKFAWTDHTSDADGYLLEIRPAGSADFTVIQVLGPTIDSCGVATLPNEKNAAYLVRAFYYGNPSNNAHQTTGAK